MKKLFAGIITLLFFIAVAAQTGNSAASVPEAQKKLDALKGTYELRQLSRNQSMLPENLADIIEKNRKDSEPNAMMLNENVELIIYPRNKIATVSGTK